MGAGTMGGGITMALVNGGIPVTIVETSGDLRSQGSHKLPPANPGNVLAVEAGTAG